MNQALFKKWAGEQGGFLTQWWKLDRGDDGAQVEIRSDKAAATERQERDHRERKEEQVQPQRD